VDFSQRAPLEGVVDLFWQRRSPRAFVKTSLPEGALARMIDAARWSPSCVNEQPWRFYTSTAETFEDYLNLLVEGNQAWAKNASVLGFLVAKRQFDRNGEANPYARFDSGAAWMAMTLQARTEGLYTHGMGGILADAAAEYLNVDTDHFDVVMGFAIGVAVDYAELDQEQKVREQPNGRVALEDIWHQR